MNPIRKAKEKLFEYIQSNKPEVKLIAINSVGWHGDHFVLSDRIYPARGDLTYHNENVHNHNFKSSGSLLAWKEHIASYAKGNSRLIMALACAFAAPLLKLANEESGAIHLVGNSSLGKTTALRVAASVWGKGDENGFIRQWRTTSNALEAIAANHSDCLLPLDELGQADSKCVGEMIYMLANNQGKARLKSSIDLRNNLSWRLLILSTGEISLQTKIAEVGKKSFAGQEVRFVSLEAAPHNGYGIFEELHGLASGEELARYLKEQSSKYYGTAIDAFLERITADQTQVTHLVKNWQNEFVEECLPEFVEECLPAKASGQVAKVARRFGLLAAAGELATLFQILPFKEGAAFNAIAKCFTSWLEYRGSQIDLEPQEALEQIRSYFERFGDSKFSLLEEHGFESKTIDRIGYKQKIQSLYHYYVLPESYRSELCKGFNYRTVTQYLIEQGYLNSDSSGKNQVVKYIPNLGRVRVYHFTPKIISDEG